MGTICILLGLIVLVLATFGGFLLSHTIISNQMIMTLLTLNASNTYIIVVSACFAVGLLICLALVMNGLIYNKVSKNNAILEHIVRD